MGDYTPKSALVSLAVGVVSLLLVFSAVGTPTEAFGFGGDSFGSGKATPTPIPSPKTNMTIDGTSAAPAQSPPTVPSPVVTDDTLHPKRCVDRSGIVVPTSHCEKVEDNYHWYWGGTGYGLGDRIAGGSFTQPGATVAASSAATPTLTKDATAAYSKLPFIMYNDTTVKTCVAANGLVKIKVVPLDYCGRDRSNNQWYYYPLRKGGKLFKIGETPKGGSFQQPAEPAATPTPSPEPNPPPTLPLSLGPGLPFSDPTIADPVVSETTTNSEHGPAPVAPPAAMPTSAEATAEAADYTLSLAKKNNSKLRPLTPDDIEQVGRAAGAAAKPLEEVAPQVWQSMVRRQYALAFSQPVWPLVLAGLAFAWPFFIKRRWIITAGTEDAEEMTYLVCVYAIPAAVTIFFGIIGLVRLSTSIARLIAPEYYAIQELIAMLATVP